jgi:hypothetical protein
MAVKRKIDKSVESFIEKGAEVKGKKGKKFKDILLALPIEMAQEIDRLVDEKGWGSRRAWILEAIHEKLTGDSSVG